MTKEELEQCGCWFTDTGECVKDDIDLKKFAKLVAEKEREACAKLCDYVYNNIVADDHIKNMAFKIRARGQE